MEGGKMNVPIALGRLTCLIALLLATGITVAKVIGFEQGDLFPDLTYTSPSGSTERLSQHSGKIIFFHLLASWCPPCGPELKEIAQLQAALEGESGIKFVVCGFRESHERTIAWAKDFVGVDTPISHTGSRFRRNRRIEFEGVSTELGVPHTWILGPDRTVISRQVGAYWEWSRHTEALRKAAQAVIVEQPPTLDLPSE